MKTLYKINKIALIATALLYVTIIFGLYAQMALGVIQLLSAISILFLWKSFNKNDKKRLAIYWLIVIIYGIGWYKSIDLNDYWWLSIIVIPMSIATYFVFILHELKNN